MRSAKIINFPVAKRCLTGQKVAPRVEIPPRTFRERVIAHQVARGESPSFGRFVAVAAGWGVVSAALLAAWALAEIVRLLAGGIP